MVWFDDEIESEVQRRLALQRLKAEEAGVLRFVFDTMMVITCVVDRSRMHDELKVLTSVRDSLHVKVRA